MRLELVSLAIREVDSDDWTNEHDIDWIKHQCITTNVEGIIEMDTQDKVEEGKCSERHKKRFSAQRGYTGSK